VTKKKLEIGCGFSSFMNHGRYERALRFVLKHQWQGNFDNIMHDEDTHQEMNSHNLSTKENCDFW
jgi:hypothetical protein